MGWMTPDSAWSLWWAVKGCAAMTNSKGTSGLPCAKSPSTRKVRECHRPATLTPAVSCVCSRSTHASVEAPKRSRTRVQAVVDLGEDQEGHAASHFGCLQVFHFLQLCQHIVSDPSAGDEGEGMLHLVQRLPGMKICVLSTTAPSQAAHLSVKILARSLTSVLSSVFGLYEAGNLQLVSRHSADHPTRG